VEESTRISTPTPTTITTSTTCKRSLSRSYSEDNIHLEEHTLLRYPIPYLLKVPKCEIFHLFDFYDFYGIKSL
jgi:hypothetical protein